MIGIVELAEAKEVTPRTVNRWVEQGCPSGLEYKGLSPRRVFDLEKVDKWINQQQKMRHAQNR